MTRQLTGVLLLSIVALVIGYYSNQAHAQGPDVKAGQAKFKQLCATCHGATGKGEGPAAAGLNPKPKDLSQTKRTDEGLKKIIAKGGGPNGLSYSMPAWGSMLSEQEIANIIAYIRSLKK